MKEKAYGSEECYSKSEEIPTAVKRDQKYERGKGKTGSSF